MKKDTTIGMGKLNGIMLIFSLFILTALYSQDTESTANNSSKGFDWDRVVVGGSLGAQFGNITIVELSPSIGYMLTQNFLAGIGGTYLYFEDNDFNYSTNIYGGRIFTNYFILENFLAHVEYEALNLEVSIPTPEHDPGDRATIGSFLVGGGVRSSLGGNSFASIMLLYNLNESLHSPYSNPILRIGFGIGL